MEIGVSYEGALGKLLKKLNDMDVTIIDDLKDIKRIINTIIFSNRIFNKVF